ncbi:ABC transporter ATP-binding protein [Hydrogenoanaerobacterium sp.]|uniref:ABC transporter ATP-binding protein n=1 Tax=Hydrogenoanaerobacterium sp. TaxID=2953763 RepID=UPI00289D6177|nr:ABC transporter ATP-binding protein [Hydrogenoanaerobacterium sp.]
MLKIENLSVNYGYITALTNVNLEVNQGEIITLIGGNGAGKTTTLMSISGLVEKARGKITFKGEDITRKAPDKIVKMGLSHVPEGRKIFPALTVYENLIAGTLGNPSLKKDRVAELIEENYLLFPRLKERATQGGGSLSGGEQQMLAIARGLMMEPDIIMLDEPSLGLAPIVVEEIFELILKIREKGKTVLLIEQNASMALSIADRGYVLETGNVILEGKGKSLLENPEVKRAYLGA